MSLRAKRYEFLTKHTFKECMSEHHRLPKSLGGGNESRNISHLPVNRHQAWHTLFQNFSADRIAAEINDRYLDPDYQLVVVRRINYDKVASRTTVFLQRATDRASIYD